MLARPWNSPRLRLGSSSSKLAIFRRGVRVDCDGELGRGRTNVDLYGRMAWEPNAEVGVDIDAEAFLGLLLERVASLG